MADNFIQIKETRIKKSNIKTFGISSEEILPQETNLGIFGLPFDLIFTTIELFSKSSEQPAKTHRQYVYVTTYQNDNYKFYEESINISDTIRKLEQS